MHSSPDLSEKKYGCLRVVAPYVKATKHSGLLYSSEQLAIVLTTGDSSASDIREEASKAFSNLKSVLAEAGSALKDIVKITLYVSDMQNFYVINEIYREFFPTYSPVRVCVEVSCLPNQARLEIEAVALKHACKAANKKGYRRTNLSNE